MRNFLLFFFLIIIAACNQHPSKNIEVTAVVEKHRPQIHFTPKEKWMNDPNGMVYFNNTFHLFYQYYPDSTVWGPMHWGHATSSDMIHWNHQPIALYPDSLGYIFSGSVVVDSNNTSGFGKDGKIPLVAIFTHHDPVGEKAGKINYQYQSLAYSIDEGKTWTKYANNPVLKNPGIKDFRDPKVSWNVESKKWIMTLAVLDRIHFYSSSNLKDWKKQSEFGSDVGAHGGVWECPDLFQLEYENEKVWILIVSINPGGPNGGSATQYFTGKFDGHTFTPFQTDTRWIDFGPDDYAGVTWANTGKRKIFLGWMGNWWYAQEVPTEKWRSAMTIPRELALEKIDDKFYVTSLPVKELISLKTTDTFNITQKSGKLHGPSYFEMSMDNIADFQIELSNDSSEKLVIGFDKKEDSFYIDRTSSGNVQFHKTFAGKHKAPRIKKANDLNIILVIDNASVELFADDGLTVMTSIFFPNKTFTNVKILTMDELKIKHVSLSGL